VARKLKGSHVVKSIGTTATANHACSGCAYDRSRPIGAGRVLTETGGGTQTERFIRCEKHRIRNDYSELHFRLNFNRLRIAASMQAPSM